MKTFSSKLITASVEWPKDYLLQRSLAKKEEEAFIPMVKSFMENIKNKVFPEILDIKHARTKEWRHPNTSDRATYEHYYVILNNMIEEIIVETYNNNTDIRTSIKLPDRIQHLFQALLNAHSMEPVSV